LPNLGTCPSMTTAVSLLTLWEIACHTPGAKIDSHRARYFPLRLRTLRARDHIVSRVSSLSRCTRSSTLSNRTSACSEPSIRGIRLHRLLRKSREATTAIGEMACLVNIAPGRPEPAICQKPTSVCSAPETPTRLPGTSTVRKLPCFSRKPC
jgi:hypothetical protein